MDRLARTRLEQVIRESNQTAREHCANFNRTAAARREPSATLSYRQLTRWMAGEVPVARAASMRVAEWHWGEPFAVLVGPPRPRPPYGGTVAFEEPGPDPVLDPGPPIRLRLYVPAGFGGDRPTGTPIDCGTFAFSLARVLAEETELVAAANRAARGVDPTYVSSPARQRAHAEWAHRRLARSWIFQTSWCDCRHAPAA